MVPDSGGRFRPWDVHATIIESSLVLRFPDSPPGTRILRAGLLWTGLGSRLLSVGLLLGSTRVRVLFSPVLAPSVLAVSPLVLLLGRTGEGTRTW
jgi:hypothetical protein